MNGDKEFKIRLSTEGDPSGAQELEQALDSVADSARSLGGEAAGAMDELAGATREEQEELHKLVQLVKASEAAVESLQKHFANNPGSKGAANALQASAETLQADREAVALLKRKVAERVEAAKAAEREAEAVKRQVEETRRAAKVEKEREDARKRAEQEQRAASRAEEQANNVREIKLRQIAQGVAFAAQQFGGAAQQIRQVADAARELDPELGDTFDTITTGIDGIQSAVAGAATGFTAGGPVGAIIGGLTGLAAPSLKKEIDGLVQSLEGLAESQAVSAGLPARIEAVRRALDVKEAAASWRELGEAIEAVDKSVEAAAKIQAAERAARQFAADEALRVARETGGDVAGAEANARAVRDENATQTLAADIASALNRVLSAQNSLDGKNAQVAVAEKNAAPELETLREEARQLATALADARLELETTRRLGEIQATNDAIRARNDEVIGASRDNRQHQDKTVEELSGLAGKLEGIPELAPVVAQIQSAISDRALSVQELQSLAGTFRSYERQLGTLGNTILQSFREQSDRLRDLESEIRNISAQQGHYNP